MKTDKIEINVSDEMHAALKSAIKTKTIELPTFEQLTEKEQAKVIDNYRDINTDYAWYESVYEDAKSIAFLMNITIQTINFSGFWSQGDGATFESVFEGNINCLEAVKEYAPLDETLHKIAADWSEISAKFMQEYKSNFSGYTKIEGPYSHSQCNRVYLENEITSNDDLQYSFDTNDSMVSHNTEIGADITRILRRLMDWLYNQLSKANDDLTSDEQVKETLIANEYTFNRETLKIDE